MQDLDYLLVDHDLLDIDKGLAQHLITANRRSRCGRYRIYII